MPANLPPEYYEKERELRNAKTPDEKISILKELLSIMPKHKGTDKLQAELRTKIKKLNKLKESEKKKRRTLSPYDIPKEGAAQIVLVGPPNSGKSLFLSTLTHAKSNSAPYPFSTLKPVVGMMNFENIQFQLIDTPPITAEFMDRGITQILYQADLLLIIGDGSDEKAVEALEEVNERLKERNITIGEGKKAILALNKMDIPGSEKRLQIIKELYKNLPVIPISTKNQQFNNLGRVIFDTLKIIRVYTKNRGSPPNLNKPIIMKKGSRVIDVAAEVHKDFLRMKYARLWNLKGVKGLRVERKYILEDGDILEFHI
ncbi:MAG: GTP-binding protein [Caldiserica bacterium]|nr:GTP-binding protein [Caldisericota bacterium]